MQEKVPKITLRNLLYEFFHCKAHKLASLFAGSGADARDIIVKGRKGKNTLIGNRRHFPAAQGDGADAAALAAAFPLHPILPERSLIRCVKARAHPLAHGAKALNVHADAMVVDCQQHRAARMAQAEKNIGT